MDVRVNEKTGDALPGETLFSFLKRLYADHPYDIIVYNSYPVVEDRPLHEGDEIVLIKRGACPPPDEYESLLTARHTPGVHAVLKAAVVGIAGLGGLGSSVALALARSGVGSLIIADFDTVEPSNLNRQQYFADQIGMTKCRALTETLLRVNPYMDIEAHETRIDGDNIGMLFSRASVIVEAFDDPAAKEMIVRYVINNMDDKAIISASGMAGYGPNNDIRTWRSGNLYVCGDGVSEARPGSGLMAPRVGICAGHQANQAIRILLGERD